MNLSPLSVQKFFDNNGRPLVAGQLFTYLAGTSTKVATASNESGTPNSNPIVLNYRGECRIWLDPTLAYKFVLAPRNDTDPPTSPIWTVDDITAQMSYQDILALITQQFIGERLWPRTAAEIAAGAAIVDYGYPPGYLQRYGGIGDGVFNCTTAMTAAVGQNAEVGGVAVTISAGIFYVTSLAVPASAVINFDSGGQLTVPFGSTLAIAGRVIAQPEMQIFNGAGAVTLSKDINPSVWANWFSGADMGAKINAAITSVSKVGPLTIRVAPGSYSYSTMIDAIDSESIRITGSDTPVGTPNLRNPRINWTAGAGSGPSIDASGSFGFELDHLSVSYSNAAYNGNLISLGIGSSLEARLSEIHHCSIQGDNGVVSAARLIELEGTLSATFYKNYFRFALRGIGCTATSNNSIAIRDCWFEKEFGAAQIQPRGGGWTIENNVFEGSTPGGPVPAVELSGELNGLSFTGNVCIDGALGTGTLIDLSSAICTSATIKDNVLGGGATAIKLSSVGGNSSAITIQNNYMVATTGVDMAASTNCSITNNRFQCTNAWIGSAPTRYWVNDNRFDSVTTAGQQVANAGVIPITLDAASGFGMLFILDAEDAAQAIFFIAGGGAASAEVADPNGLFTNTAGTASSINVYWSAGNNRYELQNLRGGTRSITVNFMSGR